MGDAFDGGGRGPASFDLGSNGILLALGGNAPTFGYPGWRSHNRTADADRAVSSA